MLLCELAASLGKGREEKQVIRLEGDLGSYEDTAGRHSLCYLGLSLTVK